MKQINWAERFSLPPEALSDAPMVELRGKRSVVVENHRGVLEYTEERVRIAVRGGALCVLGSELSIAQMTRRRLELRGVVHGLQWE